MKVDKLALGRVFDRTERLEAPLFQRPYVWNEDDNWVPLWEAIREVADHKIAGRTARPHFMALLPADHVKNYLFRTAQLQKLPTEKLYEQFWATFDTGKSYWREKVSQDIHMWDEAAIEKRSVTLFDIAERIWPRATVAEAAPA